MFDISAIAAKYEIDADKLAGSMRMHGCNIASIDTSNVNEVRFAKSVLKLILTSVVASKAQKARWTAGKSSPKQLTAEAVANPDRVCGKCEGVGKINAFGHVSGGVCFQCNGVGIIRRKGA